MAKNILLEKVEQINYLCGYKPKELMSYRLDIAYGGYRLTQLVNRSGGETDISPRLPAAQMKEYLNGFIKGIDAYRYSLSNRDYKELAKEMGIDG